MGPRSQAIAQRLPPSVDTAVNTKTREQTAEYIADMAGDLAAIALRNGLVTLAYLLDMARAEAKDSFDPKKDDR